MISCASNLQSSHIKLKCADSIQLIEKINRFVFGKLWLIIKQPYESNNCKLVLLLYAKNQQTESFPISTITNAYFDQLYFTC